MDERVIAAMVRWPDVPDVFGWLSLNAGGHWHLHKAGDALSGEHADGMLTQGEPISSVGINQFINRNYLHDAAGRWYFQNGPQRVFVRIDVAPFALHTVDSDLDRPAFVTHNGVGTNTVKRWCLDDAGHLYADTNQGAGLVASRDLEQVMSKLMTADGLPLLDVFERSDPDTLTSWDVRWNDDPVVPFHVCRFEQVPDLLGFVRYPRPDA